MQLRKIISVLCVLTLALQFVTGVSADNSPAASGECSSADGEVITWTLDGAGTVTVKGNGKVTGFDNAFADRFDQIKKIVFGSGITSVAGVDRLPALESVVLPDTLVSVGAYAFQRCGALKSINIPSSVETFGNRAFTFCGSLEKITVAEGSKNYGSYKNTLVDTLNGRVVLGCKNSVLPKDNSVGEILPYAFAGCSGLNKITVPQNISKIGEYAFADCASLEAFTVPGSLSQFRRSILDGDTALSSLTVKGGGAYTGAGNCIIENKTATLVAGCKTSVIPDDGSVKHIGKDAFSGCVGLEKIAIPEGTESIGVSAFNGCAALESISIPGTVASIGVSAFANCADLRKAVIGSGTETIGASAFEYCTKLSECEIPDSVFCVGRSAFGGTPFFGQQTGVVYAGRNAVGFNGDIPQDGVIEIRDGTLSVAAEAFRSRYADMKAATDIVIPPSVIYIGENALDTTGWYASQADGPVFAGKVLYKYKGELPADGAVVIPEGTAGIAAYAFYGLTGLAEITVPSSVRTVGDYSFSGCKGLAEITIPDGIMYIGENSINPSVTNIPGITSGSAAERYVLAYGGRSGNINGDADGNGSVTSNDARMILRYAADIESAPGRLLSAYDADNDGKIRAGDARTVLIACAG